MTKINFPHFKAKDKVKGKGGQALEAHTAGAYFQFP